MLPSREEGDRHAQDGTSRRRFASRAAANVFGRKTLRA